jgi:DNA polymerase III epsilon subunit-like protein
VESASVAASLTRVVANDSYGNVMARRSFLFGGKRGCHRTGDFAYGQSHIRPESAGHLPALPLWRIPWSVFDCQTTGLDAGLRPIDISAIDHDGRILIDTLVNPGVHIPATATVLTGIDDSAVSYAPHWRTIWPKLEMLLLAQNHIVAWSAEFDLRAIRDECARCHDLSRTTEIDSRFVDLAAIVSMFTQRESSFEDACALALVPTPTVGQQRALSRCRAPAKIIQVFAEAVHESRRT